MLLFPRCCFPTQLAAVWGLCWNICTRGGFVHDLIWMRWNLLFLPIVFASLTWLHLQVLHLWYLIAFKPQDCITQSHWVIQLNAFRDWLAFMFPSELYTVTVLTEAAMMGADIDGDVLVYLDMAQVVWPVSYCITKQGRHLKLLRNALANWIFINEGISQGRPAL